MLKIGITGGIGSGKSTLIQHFVASGIPIYNCDRRAKELMAEDKKVIADVKALLGDECYSESGELNRQFISAKVFDSEQLLSSLNSIVHPAVVRDFLMWVEHQEGQPYVILESALIFGSIVEDAVDRTVAVLAPTELRLMRVVNRDGLSVEQVEARIASQLSDDEFHKRADYTVVNIVEEDLAGAAQRLDQIFKQIAANEAKQS